MERYKEFTTVNECLTIWTMGSSMINLETVILGIENMASEMERELRFGKMELSAQALG